MQTFDLNRRLASEALGTCLLVATVVGSGIMAERLAGGNQALALLGNTLPTGAILVVLITMLGPISGAHFNPVVSLVMTRRGDLPTTELGRYIAAQIAGGCLGTFIAHLMFAVPVFAISATQRSGLAQWFAEFVATFGLLATILGISRTKPDAIPLSVGLYITAAYWFTASTSFANPAVTIARALTPTFSGIAPTNVFGFIAAQVLGAFAAAALFDWLYGAKPTRAS
jgi:glycerol uptake facilitator-like aquaporin